MPTLIIDMPSGVAGDMLLAALAALGADLTGIERDLAGLGAGPISIRAERVLRSGIAATLAVVEAPTDDPAWINTGTLKPAAEAAGQVHTHHQHDHDHTHTHDLHHHHQHHHHGHDQGHVHHAHRPYRAVRELIARAALPPRVAERAQRVFRLLAEAEGEVHGMPADEVLLHEVGAIDAIADVVGCCLALEQLGVTRILASPLLPGEGSVRCAHGLMPVPVPAVAAMLARTGAPHRRLREETGELTTPTGCALVCALADGWLGGDETFAARAVGYGAGSKDFPGRANVVRCLLVDDAAVTERIAELRCQVDDATGEALAALVEELIAAGARDAYLTPVLMKKGRPGHELTVLCEPQARERFSALVLAHSSTIGLRWQTLARDVLPRRSDEVVIDGERIPLKVVTLPDGTERAKPEADAVAAAARRLGRSFAAVQQAALAAWAARRG